MHAEWFASRLTLVRPHGCLATYSYSRTGRECGARRDAISWSYRTPKPEGRTHSGCPTKLENGSHTPLNRDGAGSNTVVRPKIKGTLRASTISSLIHHNIMNQGTKRSILRWIHIVFSIPIIGYVYSPFEEIPNYAPAVRFVFLPILVLTGLLMWKRHVIRRLMSNKSGPRDATENP